MVSVTQLLFTHKVPNQVLGILSIKTTLVLPSLAFLARFSIK